MEKWTRFPAIFRRQIIMSGLTGIGCTGLATMVYFISKDRILLLLSGVILLFCLGKCVSLWSITATGRYHVMEGICQISKGYVLRYRKVQITDFEGNTTTVLIDRKSVMKNDAYYRLYFQSGINNKTGNSKLDAALLSDSLIGFEEVNPEEIIAR